MKRPVKKKKFCVGDFVEVRKNHRSFPCLYKGQLGVVTAVEEGEPVVHFRCGHLLHMETKSLRFTNVDWRIESERQCREWVNDFRLQ